MIRAEERDVALGFLTDKPTRRQPKSMAAGEERDPSEMANLFPEDTGLPVTVWVNPRGRARHAARVKVCGVAGNTMVPGDTAVMSVAAEPAIVAGTLRPDYAKPVAQWISRNQEALLDYWSGSIGTGALMRRLKKLRPGTRTR